MCLGYGERHRDGGVHKITYFLYKGKELYGIEKSCWRGAGSRTIAFFAVCRRKASEETEEGLEFAFFFWVRSPRDVTLGGWMGVPVAQPPH